MKKVQQHEFDLDFGDLKQYFPVNLVLPGIFKIVQDLFGNHIIFILFIVPHILLFTLFLMLLKLLLLPLFYAGLRFEEIDDSEVWHSDVRVFSVLESGSGELMGYFYLDMYTRSKSTHFSFYSVHSFSFCLFIYVYCFFMCTKVVTQV